MLIDSIKLKNFRQFKDEKIIFSKDPDRNVTIIFGENGAGKTTLAQAFFWCFYGFDSTKFQKKDILNKEVAEELKPNETATVEVEVKLTHGMFDYTICRKQVFKRNYNNKITAEKEDLYVARKNLESGRTENLKPVDAQLEIHSILPKDLSSYFFFDGERIEELSKSVLSTRINKQFKEAVNGLTGLKAVSNALEHLNPDHVNTVVGMFNKQLLNSLDEDLKKAVSNLENSKKKLENYEKTLDETDEYLNDLEDEKNELSKELREFEDSKKLENTRIQLNNDISSKKSEIQKIDNLIFKEFQEKQYPFFLKPLVYKAIEALKSKKFNKTIYPNIDAKTIQFILDSGYCICGEELKENDEHVQHLKDLIQFLPPNSISTLINQFIRDTKIKFNKSGELNDGLDVLIEQKNKKENEVEDLDDRIFKISQLLKGADFDQIRKIENKREDIERTIKKTLEKRKEINQDIGRLSHQIDLLAEKVDDLSTHTESNEKIRLAKEYATRIYNDLDSEFRNKEKEVRSELEKSINEIFKTIYKDSLKLEIDDNYRVNVSLKDLEGEIETSTAQSISVIFAFIAAITKMAKENQSKDETLIEPYPLVMDAPLSAFDKRRIKSISETIPETAEQVVIFIKDTDGDIAEKYMGNRISNKYTLNKINELETRIE